MAQPIARRDRRSRRKEQVMAAAAHLFQEFGYHNVSMDDIATALGLTGPALYRHFGNKHDVLAHALTEQLSSVRMVAERVLDEEPDPGKQLSRFLTDLGALVTEREEALLWKRERRHLTGDEQVEFRQHLRRVLELSVTIMRGSRPGLSDSDAALFGWAVLSLYSNTRDYRAGLDPARVRELLRDMACAALECELPEPDDTLPPPGAVTIHRPAGRRERVLNAAVTLFDRRGYHSVSIEDIAEASDTAIATVYQHFSGKADLLNSVLVRGAEGLHYVTSHRLSMARGPDNVLDALVRSYIELALGPHRRVLGILTADLIYLPDESRQAIRKSEREYVEEWVAAVRGIRADLTVAEARGVAQSVIGMVTDIVQTPGLRARPGIADELHDLVWAVLRA